MKPSSVHNNQTDILFSYARDLYYCIVLQNEVTLRRMRRVFITLMSFMERYLSLGDIIGILRSIHFGQ